jgi:UDP-2-acetamido-2,6-beta-L-arabino-hexul-4-ose reductase
VAKIVRRILVTGANGFIGKNLIVRLRESSEFSVQTFVRGDDVLSLPHLIEQSDAVIHLAGENRPKDVSAFEQVNTGLTIELCNAIKQEGMRTGRQISMVLASSTQADRDNPYGRSKLSAERAVEALSHSMNSPAVVFRLPGVFGKWCKPSYNSVVATFCHNIARGLPIHIDDPKVELTLAYIDDVVKALISAIDRPPSFTNGVITPEYTTTLGELANQIRAFENCRSSLMSERVGTGLVRALYATYISYLPSERFSYHLPQHCDKRGAFVEMLKTPDSGQFSYFTAGPGITRGGHYHHTKTEKFLVIKGEAVFRFRSLMSNELIELHTSGDKAQVVDTIPGWSHDITNVGSEEMIVMLWANEVFDRQNPDTVASEVNR